MRGNWRCHPRTPAARPPALPKRGLDEAFDRELIGPVDVRELALSAKNTGGKTAGVTETGTG